MNKELRRVLELDETETESSDDAGVPDDYPAIPPTPTPGSISTHPAAMGTNGWHGGGGGSGGGGGDGALGSKGSLLQSLTSTQKPRLHMASAVTKPPASGDRSLSLMTNKKETGENQG